MPLLARLAPWSPECEPITLEIPFSAQAPQSAVIASKQTTGRTFPLQLDFYTCTATFTRSIHLHVCWISFFVCYRSSKVSPDVFFFILSGTMGLSGTYGGIGGSSDDLHRLENGRKSDATSVKSRRFRLPIIITIVAVSAIVFYIAFSRYMPMQWSATRIWTPESCTPMLVSGKASTLSSSRYLYHYISRIPNGSSLLKNRNSVCFAVVQAMFITIVINDSLSFIFLRPAA